MTDNRRDAEATRARILEAARAVFVEGGFDGARVDAIARRARSNKRMIYVYFGSKEGLYDEVLRSAIGEALAHSLRPDEDAPPREQVTAAIRNYFQYLSENPVYARLLAWESLRDSFRADEALVELAATQLAALRAAVERGVAEGVFRPGLDVGRVTSLVAGMISSHFSEAARHAALSGTSEPASSEAWLATIVDFVLAAISYKG